MESNLTIGAILSSSELLDKVQRLAKVEFNKVHAELVFGLDEAIPVGKTMVDKGVDVIVGRSCVAELLRENLHVPVVPVKVNSLDILTSVKVAVTYGKRILITTFRTPLQNMEILEELFNVKIIQGIYYGSASLEQVIAGARDKGVDVIIGGGCSAKYAQKYDMRTVDLYVSEDAVAFAIEDALSLARLSRQEQEKSKRYQCIIDATSDAILSTNRSGVITTMNRAARELFCIDDDVTEPHCLCDYLPKADFKKIYDTKQPLFNKLERIRGALYLTNYMPIPVNEQIAGVVSIFKNTDNVIQDGNEVRRNISKGLVAKFTIEDLIHVSAAMRDVVKKVRRYASSDSTILVSGETGTGKEILAQSIHNMGRRVKGPFVSINCAALPDQLLENELFGHEEGAFTGSRKGGKIGLFELAHTGTIFLDEIASTPPSVQASLLRVLQEKKVMRIGSDRLIPIDVRVIAATNKNLVGEVRAGRFREDLFYRLNVLAIQLPPMRERIEDLPVIVENLIMRISDKYGIAPLMIPETCVRRLMRYPWPGNVRQLENFVERLLLLSDAAFDPDIFQELFREIEQIDVGESPAPGGQRDLMGDTANARKKVINEVLMDAKFCRTKAARMLGVSRTTLWRRMKSLS